MFTGPRGEFVVMAKGGWLRYTPAKTNWGGTWGVWAWV